MKFPSEVKKQLLELGNRNVFLEGNILKTIDSEGDAEFDAYIKKATERDRESRRRRLEITKQIQTQNRDLTEKEAENVRLMEELREALKASEETSEQIATQNKELLDWKEENERISQELKDEMKRSEEARFDAIKAKEHAENDLDLLQKKSQTELISTIVKVALGVIVTVGFITTGMYIAAMLTGKDTQIIGSTWSNMFGILLTNAFSIVGTIMGVKYASESNKPQ